MRTFRRLGFLAFFFAALIAGAWFSFSPATVLAQIDTTGLQAVGAVTQLTATDPRVIAVRIINIALGLLGIITLTIVLYAGFTWMTAGGDAEKVEKAKKLLRNAIIGLIIILSSWALTTYIISRLLEATGAGGGGTSGGAGGPGGGGFGGGPSSGFQVQSISPVGTTTIRNIEVRFIFTRDVSPSSAATQITVVRVSDNAPVSGTTTVSGSLVTFVPSAACPDPNAARRCFDADTPYEAQVGGSLQSSDHRTISCGGFAPSCRVRFTSGSVVDTAAPTVAILSPFDGQSISASSTQRILSRASDDSGISSIETSADGRLIDRASPTATSTPTAYDGSVVWDPAGLSLGSHALQSRAFDIDSNNGSSPVVNVALRAGHCFNRLRDADEPAIDCGGRDCGACSGGVCTRGTDCRSGVCRSGVCVEQPIITGMSPGNGRIGTFVTISGENFGLSGQVHFWNGSAFSVLASAPTACAGVVSWSPTQVLVTVPAGAMSGPIRLTNGSSTLFDATNDANGPVLGDYAVNDVLRPGVCAVIPPSAPADTEISFRGVGFGASQGAADRVFFNDGADREIASYGAWSDREVRIITPRIPPLTYAAHVHAGGADSNTIAFTLTAPVVTTPIIDSLDPTATSVGSYVTINGRNFGDRPGTVRFRSLSGDGSVGFGEVPTIPQCAAAWWRDASIIVKVPAQLGTAPLTRPTTAGLYEISIVRPDAGSPTSNALNFTIRAGAASPGICAIEPIAGPAGVTTTLYGEQFGSSPDRATFNGPLGRLNATVNSWTSNQIEVAVPSTARTGPVKALVGPETSNGVNFQVRNCQENPEMICGATRQCCTNGTCAPTGRSCPIGFTTAQYAWQTSTGEIPISPRVVEDCDTASASPPPPSPSPWNNRADGTNTCLNAAIAVRFTTRLNPASIAGNFLVRKCTGTGTDPCATGTPVDISGTPVLRNVNTNSDYLYFRPPSGAWDPSSTYAVSLRTGIRSFGANVAMEDNPACGAGMSYCFRFVTGDTDARCTVSRVSVTPNPFTANEVGQLVPYHAVPLTGSCLVLDDAINWRWYTGGGTALTADDRAIISNTAIAGVVSGAQQATALQETGARPVPVHAATNIPGQSVVVGTAQLSVTFIPPTVTEFAPNCNKACVNATLWAKFNVSMDPARATSRQIILRRCENESCTTYDPPTPLLLRDGDIQLTNTTLPGGREILNFLEITPPPSFLLPGSYYRVTLRNGTNGWFSRTGLPLDVSRAGAQASPEGFSWTFRVKTENGGLCTASRVDVIPIEKYETLIGARQLFSARPISPPDECSSIGQRLIATEAFSWRVQNADVARLLPGSTGGLVDTTPLLPPGCSNRCLNTGSQGVEGRIANCGNGITETTDPAYFHRTPGSVLLPGGAQGSEECDLGAGHNGIVGALCSNACLWTGLTGPLCGNGVLDRGEQCDAKERVCGVGPNQGLVCFADADCGGGRCNALRDRPGCSAGCLSAGSSGGSVCGEGTVGYGETCDDGNTVAGDGCSNVCLHEGSSRVISTCGNGVVEPGESCERIGGVWPANCDRLTCLNQGTPACSTAVTTNCCGNRTVEGGEDCDGTPGCSNRCLKMGSNVSYATPSFCGDGLPLGIGEQCEAATNGDGLIDGAQLAETVGLGTVGTDLRMSTQIQTTYQTANGASTYGLQCGRTRESECNPTGGNENGLTIQGCCMRRPTVTDARFPLPGDTSICRNTLIFAEFDQRMDEGSIGNNFLLAEENPGTVCAAGTQRLEGLPRASRDWREFFAGIWQKIIRIFTGQAAQAEVWCVGRVSGSIQYEDVRRGAATTTRMTFTISEALRPNTRYQILFRGDIDLTDTSSSGTRNRLGTVMAGDTSWNFTTSERVCAANQVVIRDANEEHSFLFQTANEAHPYSGLIQSQQNGRLVPIVPVPQYHWVWNPWISEIPAVLAVGTTVADPLNRQSTSTIQADNRNGSALIFAGIHIDVDTANVPSTVGANVTASQLSTVMLCQRPWPFAAPAYRGATPPAIRFEDRIYNFSMLYCMDGANAASTTDDIPPLIAHAVTSTLRETARGILRQYFFDYPTATDPLLRNDGIGIRIVANPLHLSPLAWYQTQGFAGTPTPVTVDGYEGIQDGTTIYAAAVNTANDPNAGAVSTTIYLISYNADAQPLTKDLFRQLVDNWTFNINLTVAADNTCKRPDGSSLLVGGRLVPCTADWECARETGVNATCASVKSKLQRDSVRVAHFQQLMERLESVNTTTGAYPTIGSGSFIQGMTNSRWPSWQSAFGAALNGAVPEDPVNRLLTCGRCKSPTGALGKPCMDVSECAAGDSCAAENGFDPATCWNAERQRAICPQWDRPVSATPILPSRLYQYRSIDQGARYELSTELEGPNAERYSPSLPSEIKHCSGSGPTRLCSTDADCGAGRTCVGTGGRWVYRGMCSSAEYGSDSVCGNRVVGPGELCELGDTHTETCTAAGGRPGTKIQSCSECRAFADTASTVCVPDQTCGNGVVERYKCYGGAGFRYGQSCRTPSAPAASSECSDPRDPSSITMTCDSVNNHDGAEEACDDGALNGTYGRCNRTCTGIGATCGDGLLSLGESCDQGAANGEYCDTASFFARCNLADSCSSDCRGRAPYCGDRTVQTGSGEQCDGTNPERTPGAICSGGDRAEQPCQTDADCPGTGGRCGVAPLLWDSVRYAACPTIRRCTNDRTLACTANADCTGTGICATYPQQHTRSCGAPDGTVNQCRWTQWSVCQPLNFCGDGTVDSGEQCDDGNANNNDSCTNSCRPNVCGDGVMNIGIEECDRGPENGGTCSADYGSTCARCSTSCRQEAQSGGYCGDGVRNGAEQCDRTDIPPTSCRALGFDYANQNLCHQLGYVATDDGTFRGLTRNGFCCSGPQVGRIGPDLDDPLRTACLVAFPESPAPGCLVHPDSGTNRVEAPSELRARVCEPGTLREELTCSAVCGYSGCGRCSDTPAPSEATSISGRVFDAVYSTQPVPNARVTLYYQGVRITETFANDDGNFTFNGINRRLECGGYRLIVDSYRDNPCTPLTAGATTPTCGGSTPIGVGENEGRYGGYWPYESRVFNASNFASQGVSNPDGNIYLAPRVGPEETLVLRTWDTSRGGQYIDGHLLLPLGMSYQEPVPPTTPPTWTACSGGACMRDVYWEKPGDANLNNVPHAKLYCFNSLGGEGCTDELSAVEPTRFKRSISGSWGLTGLASYYVVNSFRSADTLQSISQGVRVITFDRQYVITPPAPTDASCNKYWLVFQENMRDGTLTFPAAGDPQYFCDAPPMSMPSEPAGTHFPGQLLGT